MRVIFRTDSSNNIGSGHLMRCLTLAIELRSRGAEVEFICREHPGHFISVLEEANFLVHRLPISQYQSMTLVNVYSSWLGVSVEQDLSETLKIINSHYYDWLVVDHYGLDQTWERSLRSAVGGILVIDDLADRMHDCDMLLDQNYFGERTKSRYVDKVSDSCECFLGPRYALVQPQYFQLRKILPPHNGQIQRVLIFFGGTDADNQTNKALTALDCPDLAYLAVDVVIGANHSDPEGIASMVAKRPRTTLYRRLPTLAGLMARADLLLVAGGATTWERMCLGRPSIVASLADNQQEFTQALADNNFQVSLAKGKLASAYDWKQAICEIIDQPDSVKQMIKNTKNLVDGLGVKRVALALLGIKSIDLVIRKVNGLKELESFDKDFLKDCATVDGSWQLDESKLNYPSCLVLLAEDKDGLPIGCVFFEQDIPRSEVLLGVSIEESLQKSHVLEQLISRAIAYKINTQSTHKSIPEPQNRDFNTRQLFVRLKTPKYTPHEPHQHLKISIISDNNTWLLQEIEQLQFMWLQQGYAINWVYHPDDLGQGDICFILSCSQILRPEHLALHRHNLVVHSSDLPKGRGWSPMSWQILEGKNKIVTTLFEASTAVDAGVIYAQKNIELDGTELVTEWRNMQAQVTKTLCAEWVAEFPESRYKQRPQIGESNYYSRRTAADSMIDPNKTIFEQFNLLRIVDNEKYPAFFDVKGERYHLKIEKVSAIE